MAAKRFLAKSLSGLKDWEQPEVINTDKAPTYAAALAELKDEGKCPKNTQHPQVKYLNNIVEADHGKLKQLISAVRGFKSMKTAYATIKGFEVMRALRKGQAAIFNLTRDIVGEARLVERAFGLGPCALTEAVQLVGEWLEAAVARAQPLAQSITRYSRKFATEPTGRGAAVDTTQPQGRMVFGILAVMAEFSGKSRGTHCGRNGGAQRRGVRVGRPLKLSEYQRRQPVMLDAGRSRAGGER